MQIVTPMELPSEKMLQLVSCDRCYEHIPSCAVYTQRIFVPSVYKYHAECLEDMSLFDSKLF